MMQLLIKTKKNPFYASYLVINFALWNNPCLRCISIDSEGARAIKRDESNCLSLAIVDQTPPAFRLAVVKRCLKAIHFILYSLFCPASLLRSRTLFFRGQLFDIFQILAINRARVKTGSFEKFRVFFNSTDRLGWLFHCLWLGKVCF